MLGLGFDALRDHDVTFEEGAVDDRDLAELDDAADELQEDDAFFKIVVLADRVTTAPSVRAFAQQILAGLGGRGRVLVYDPASVGVATDVDPSSEATRAEDAAIESANETDSFADGALAAGRVLIGSSVPAQVDGTYAASIRIARGGRIVAEAAGGQLVSDSFVLTVVPRIAVSAKPHRVKARSLVKVRAKIRPADAATRAFLDVYDVLRKRWRSSKDVGVSKTGVATFSLRVAKGTTRVRVRVPNSARVQGFAPVTSKPVTVVGT